MTHTQEYAIPVTGDKVFRSPRHGQTILRNMKGVRRIFVDDRKNSFINNRGSELVKVVITTDTEQDFIACCIKGREMILKILEETPKKPTPHGIWKGVYQVPVEADKVFRSKKHGQTTMKEHHPTCKIRVEERVEGNPMVRIFISGPSKYETDACFREGNELVKKLLASLPKSERSNPTKDLTMEEKAEDFIKRVKNLIFSREILGFENHEDSRDIKKLIEMREKKGITNHYELGNFWRPKREEVLLDDIVGCEVSIDSWGDHAEIWQKVQMENPDVLVVA